MMKGFFTRIPRRLLWSHISWFSNSPFAKATLLTPVVAQYVILSREYLETAWGFNSAVWLYWSLIMLALSQAFYTLFAPRIIKRYGDGRENFIEKAMYTYDERQLGIIRTSIIRSYFVDYNGTPFRLNTDNGSLEDTIREKIPSHFLQHRSDRAGIEENIKILNEFFSQIHNDNPTFRGLNLSRQEISDAFRNHIEGQITEDNSHYKELQALMTFNEFNDSAKKRLLNFEYDRRNQQDVTITIICAILIAVGSIYFLWNAILNFMLVVNLMMS
ncbi:MAG: hypothetical protein AAGI03_02130 [Pseudomonadota bacterium]